MRPSYLLLVALALCADARGTTNTRPIIGILTQPTSPELIEHGAAFISAAYVKWAESGGARVVPLIHTSSTAVLRETLGKINGVLLPGGGVIWDEQPQYMAALSLAFAAAKEYNDAGEYFPLWGTCLGMEELLMMAAGDMHGAVLQCGFDARNVSWTVGFTNLSNSSRLYSGVPQEVYSSYATMPIAYHSHKCGIEVEAFRNNTNISNFFSSLSEDKDRKGRPFVSSIEAIKYPMYGIMWHPEKSLFEWNKKEAIPRTAENGLAAYSLAKFLVSEASKSTHRFSSEKEETEALIYMTPAVFTANVKQSMQQCYFFDPLPSVNISSSLTEESEQPTSGASSTTSAVFIAGCVMIAFGVIAIIVAVLTVIQRRLSKSISAGYKQMNIQKS